MTSQQFLPHIPNDNHALQKKNRAGVDYIFLFVYNETKQMHVFEDFVLFVHEKERRDSITKDEISYQNKDITSKYLAERMTKQITFDLWN